MNKSIELNVLNIEFLPVGVLKPNAGNPRKHSKAQIQQIAESIKTFGFVNPLVVDAEGGVLAGHGRLEAAKRLRMEQVPTIRVEHLNAAQKKAYVIADNRLAEKSSWNEGRLAIEFSDLLQMDGGFDVSVTGFEMPEIDLKVQELDEHDAEGDDEEVPEVRAQVVTKPGDVWQLGGHRVICGDALNNQTYAALMPDEKAQMVLTDPPYNVPIQGHVGGLGKTKHDEFPMASGEMTPKEFRSFLSKTCAFAAAHSVSGSIHFVFMDWRHIDDLLAAGKVFYSELKNLCVWNKDNGGMGSLYRSKHELVAVFKYGDAPHINNVALGKYGRYRTNVWNYRGVNTLRNGREDELAMHPTVKPVRMLQDAIMDCSEPEGLVLDLFGGSGSTLIAAERTRRRARLIELEPKYVDVIVRRWQALTGQEAVHAGSGKTFNVQEQEGGLHE